MSKRFGLVILGIVAPLRLATPATATQEVQPPGREAPVADISTMMETYLIRARGNGSWPGLVARAMLS